LGCACEQTILWALLALKLMVFFDSRPCVGNKLKWMMSIYMANYALLFTLGLFTPFVKNT
jgi:hypothetical protein